MSWLFCDLDGTLADSLPAMRRVLDQFLAAHDASTPADLFDSLNGRSLPEIIDALADRFGLPGGRAALIERYEGMIEGAYSDGVVPAPGADALVRGAAAAGFKLMLVTSGTRGPAQRFLARQGWLPLFAGCVFGDEVRHAKPAPDIYALAIARSGAAGAEAIVVEDSPAGVAAASAAGLRVIGYAGDGAGRSAALTARGAGAVVGALSDVLPLASAWRRT